MLGNWTTPALAAAKFCVPWNPSDNLMDLYNQAANQFNTDSDPSLAAMIVVALQNQMMLYNKSTCTDCATQGLPPTQTVILAGTSGVQTAAPSGVVQSNTTDITADTAISTAAQSATGIASALGAAASTLPIVGAVASVITDIAGIFTSAHAQAVAQEQATNCAVAFAFNKYIPQYDLAVANGTLTAEAALADVTQIIQQQLQPELSDVISGNNIGWGENQILMAHLWFRQQWYPTLEANAESLAGTASSVIASVESNPIALVILAGLAALLLLGG